ncbi:MAG: hypothetical protein NG740_05510 [Omnitrophica bacterium]|nr:hypothetical protein [Candidatus Omnitrophota bacterium]
MDFVSVRFVIFMSFAILAFHLCSKKYRAKLIMPLLNAFFILTFVKHPTELWPFALFLVTGFWCIKLMERFPTKKNAALTIGAILTLFIYVKKYAFFSIVPFMRGVYLTIGLSYILFRILHILIDIYGGAIKERFSALTFFNYTCMFLTFIAGPIQRFQEYQAVERNLGEKVPLKREDIRKDLSRIVNGYFKVTLLSPVFLFIFNEFFTRIDSARYEATSFILCVVYTGACFVYTLHLYCNVSGYMDIVVSLGRFLGLQLPENFNKPFLSKSFLEFWSRWHITLSNWFKFYVFNPIVKALIQRRNKAGLIPYYGVIAFFVVFFLVGVWHGSSPAFLIFGLFLGFGMSINKLYEVLLRRRLGKKAYARVCESRWHRALGSGLTYSYFSMGATCIWMDFDKLMWLFRKIGIFGLLGVFLLGGLLAASVIALFSVLICWRDAGYERLYFLGRNLYFRQGYLSLKAFILLLFLVSKSHSVPEFIYKAF